MPDVSGPDVSELEASGLDVSELDVSGLDVSGLEISGLEVSELEVSGLEVSGLEGGYGDSQVLFDVNFQVPHGEIVGLLGRNGMGKTTTISTIFGLLPARAGTVRFDGADLLKKHSTQIARAGLSLAPEGRQVFPLLTVEEHLRATERASPTGLRRWTPDLVFEFFPRLAQCRTNFGNQLSGGEQQMLSIGRALVMNPKLLVLDEATEGLAPSVRSDIWSALRQLKDEGQSILVVDAHLHELLKLTDYNMILENGRTVWSGSSAELARSADVKANYLGVGAVRST